MTLNLRVGLKQFTTGEVPVTTPQQTVGHELDFAMSSAPCLILALDTFPSLVHRSFLLFLSCVIMSFQNFRSFMLVKMYLFCFHPRALICMKMGARTQASYAQGNGKNLGFMNWSI